MIIHTYFSKGGIMDYRKISIVISEKDSQTCLDLKNAISLDRSFNIIAATDSISSTYRALLKSSKTDLVFINADDEEVNLLEPLMTNIPNRPILIITMKSANQQKIMESLQSTVDYFLVKPINFDTVAREIKEVYYLKRLPPHAAYNVKESTNALEFTVKQLNNVPVASHLKGYHYLITGISALIEDQSMKDNITKALYPFIAKKWNSTPARIERSIRNAITLAWENGGDEYIAQLTKDSTTKPSNSQFMNAIEEAYNSKFSVCLMP